jgi:RimJ/RimL family protein N-acetyltransferase/transcriptional antiterminator Rof (Rho-off)
MKNAPVLVTERLTLSPPTAADIPNIVQFASDARIAEYTLSIPFPYAEKDAQKWLDMTHAGLESGLQYVFAIRQQDTHALMGGIDLRLNVQHNRAELGYWLGTYFWNQGYMTEAATAVLDFGFNTLLLNRIFAFHIAHNPASGEVMKKIGMQPEGIQRQCVRKDDTYYDGVFYAILREDFEQQQAKSAYKPINCSYYDELEALATQRTAVAVVYQLPDGTPHTVHAQIVDLFTRDKEEFMVLDNGTTIRLDAIISVDGKAPDLHC